MSSDFEIEPGLPFGDWLYTQIEQNAVVEKQGFFVDRVEAVATRLQAGRPADRRFTVAIPWLRAFTAFTAPGRYIYFGRRLLERCPDEDSTAFVIAHEMAHHDLGHLELFTGPFARHAARLGAGQLVVLFFRMLQKRIYSPEWECDADRAAIDLCVAAGYDPAKCLKVFRILEDHLLNHGDVVGVYGLDEESDEELSPEASVVTRARIWLFLRQRGYLPVRDRHALLVKHLDDGEHAPVQIPT